MGRRQCLPLVGVHADTEDSLAGLGRGGDLLQRAVAGHAAGAEDDVSALVHCLASRGSAPFGIGEGHIHAAGMVGGDDVDVRVDGLGAGFVAFLEGHNRRHQVGAQHGGDGAGLRQLGGQRAGQIAGLIFVEDQAGQVGNLFALELVDADEVDVRVVRRPLQRWPRPAQNRR